MAAIVCYEKAPDHLGRDVRCELDDHPDTTTHYSDAFGIEWCALCGCDPDEHVGNYRAMSGWLCATCGECQEAPSGFDKFEARKNLDVMYDEDTWLDHDLDPVKSLPAADGEWARVLYKAATVYRDNRQNTAQNIAMRRAARRVLQAWKEACALAGIERVEVPLA